MVDDILNAVLFLLIGLEMLTPKFGGRMLWAALALVPITLTARLASVVLPMSALGLKIHHPKGLVPLLVWGGLRGGLSIAMVLSLPPVPERELFLLCTFG